MKQYRVVTRHNGRCAIQYRWAKWWPFWRYIRNSWDEIREESKEYTIQMVNTMVKNDQYERERRSFKSQVVYGPVPP